MIKDWQRQQELKKTLKPFWQEVSKNLELFYVMDQRQVIDHIFTMAQWEKTKQLPKIEFSDVIQQYVSSLEEFNRVFIDFKSFEKWYSGDAQRKTRENAQQLHAKKALVSETFKTLRPILEQAKETLTQRLLTIGVLK